MSVMDLTSNKVLPIEIRKVENNIT